MFFFWDVMFQVFFAGFLLAFPSIVILVIFSLFDNKAKNQVAGWQAEKGLVIQSSISEKLSGFVYNGSVGPIDEVVERLDVGVFSLWRGSLLRMQLHLVMDTIVHFELSPKRVKRGKVFEVGEGKSGIDVVDEVVWVETADLKSTVWVLEDSTVQKLLSKTVASSRKIRVIEAEGNRIEILLEDRKRLEQAFQLGLAIAHRIAEYEQSR